MSAIVQKCVDTLNTDILQRFKHIDVDNSSIKTTPFVFKLIVIKFYTLIINNLSDNIEIIDPIFNKLIKNILANTSSSNNECKYIISNGNETSMCAKITDQEHCHEHSTIKNNSDDVFNQLYQKYVQQFEFDQSIVDFVTQTDLFKFNTSICSHIFIDINDLNINTIIDDLNTITDNEIIDIFVDNVKKLLISIIKSSVIQYNQDETSTSSIPSSTPTPSSTSTSSTSSSIGSDYYNIINVDGVNIYKYKDNKCAGSTNKMKGRCCKYCTKDNKSISNPDSNGNVWATCNSHKGNDIFVGSINIIPSSTSSNSTPISTASSSTSNPSSNPSGDGKCYGITSDKNRCKCYPSKAGCKTNKGNPACIKHSGLDDFTSINPSSASSASSSFSTSTSSNPVSKTKSQPSPDRCNAVTLAHTQCTIKASGEYKTEGGHNACKKHHGKKDFNHNS